MEDIVLVHKDDELKHYGVKGMRWGVRRASKRLASATTKEEKTKAVSSLKKHREKGTAKIQKLEKKAVKLEKASEQKIIKDENKAAKLNQKAAKKKQKAYRRFTSKDKADKLLYKANKLEARANMLTANSNKAKAKVESNAAMRKAFEREISNIDSALSNKGRRYLSA